VIYLLDFRGANVGGAVVPGRIVPGPGLGTEMDLRAESKITFLTHGFNVNRQQGTDSLLRMARALALQPDEALVAILWPGDHWVRAASYSFEGNDADDSAAQLARYVNDVVTAGTELSFVSHSLGARVVMETIKRLSSRRVRQVCLLAAAIDDFSVADPKEYFDATGRAQRVAVLASREDKVLKFAYPAGDVLQAFIFFWKDEIGLALGYHGPKAARRNAVPLQVYHEQIPDERKSDHGHYLLGPPPLPGERPSVAFLNQTSSVAFVNEVLRGVLEPKYP
jgi:Alpha/beta hydrolase of unknown function (DUF900)